MFVRLSFRVFHLLVQVVCWLVGRLAVVIVIIIVVVVAACVVSVILFVIDERQ